MASGSRKPLSEFARFQYNFETSFVADALLDPILSQLPLLVLKQTVLIQEFWHRSTPRSTLGKLSKRDAFVR